MPIDILLPALLPVALGALTGALLGLTGAGGGIVAGPLLMLVLGLPLTEAAPISLFAIALGCGTAVLLTLRLHIIEYRMALLLAAMGIVGTPLGIHLSRTLPTAPLLIGFAALLLYRAVRLWQPRDTLRDEVQPCATDGAGRFIWNRPCARAMAWAGLLAGFFGGLLGIGGGFVLVPAMRKHTPLSMHAIVATSLAALTLVSFAGLAQWTAHAPMNWATGIPFIGGTVIGIAAGRIATPRIPEHGLRRTFAALCVAIAAALAYRALRQLI